jgi:hypothetical protein
MCVGVAAFALAPLAVSADHQWIQGRTGLPTVRDGKENIEMQTGLVHLRVVGNTLEVNQEFHLKYPGPPLETGATDAKIAFREDSYMGHHKGRPSVSPSSARGFNAWSAWVDGIRVVPEITGWELNDKKDTATRWRNIRMFFYPGQMRTLRVVSVAPLGMDNNQRTIEFVSKDIGHFRRSPDFLEIRVTMPGVTEAFLTELEPKASSIGPNGIRWVYQKADPDRDVSIKLPMNWRRASLP